MTLSSRHRIRNSIPGGLRPSTLPLGHGGSPQYWFSHVDGEETFFVSFKPPRPGTEPRTLAWKAAVLTTTLGPPPFSIWNHHKWLSWLSRFNRISMLSVGYGSTTMINISFFQCVNRFYTSEFDGDRIKTVPTLKGCTRWYNINTTLDDKVLMWEKIFMKKIVVITWIYFWTGAVR